MGVRRFFWNIKESFVGVEFLKYAPIQAAILPVSVLIPAYLFINAQKGKKQNSINFSQEI